MEEMNTIMLTFIFLLNEYTQPLNFDFNISYYIKNYIDINIINFDESSTFFKTYNIIKLIFFIIPFTILIIIELVIHNTLVFIDNFIFLSRFNCPIYKWFRWITFSLYFIIYYSIILLIEIFFSFIDHFIAGLSIVGGLYILGQIIN